MIDHDDTRPLLAQALAAAVPGTHVVDAAAAVNRLVDAFEDGDPRGLRALKRFFEDVLAASKPATEGE